MESWSIEFRSVDRMCLLKAAMVVSSLIFFGMMAHTLGPIHLKECFPKVMVLNLGST